MWCPRTALFICHIKVRELYHLALKILVVISWSFSSSQRKKARILHIARAHSLLQDVLETIQSMLHVPYMQW